MSCIYKYYLFHNYSSRINVYSYKMSVYELWVRVVGREMPWSRVACKSVFCVPCVSKFQRTRRLSDFQFLLFYCYMALDNELHW